jgi:hypothetical protein
MITTIIYGFLLAWLFTEFPAFKYLVDMIPSNKYTNAIKSALRCHKCMSLWITLILFWNPIAAIAASFLAATYSRLIGALPINL